METVHDMKAILGEDFFKEEVRCDYLVSAKMKRIWAVELDMYLSFAEICEKYGLNHFLIAGSLLGAVRHNGFIPWDDDMDIGMTREQRRRNGGQPGNRRAKREQQAKDKETVCLFLVHISSASLQWYIRRRGGKRGSFCSCRLKRPRPRPYRDPRRSNIRRIPRRMHN